MGSKPSKPKSKDRRESKGASTAAAASSLPQPAAVPAIDPRFPLTARDKFSLVKSWKNIGRNLESTGKEMMIKLLADEEMKQYFPKFRDKTSDQLRSDEDFEEIAMTHIQSYDQAIQDSDLVDNLISNLEKVGRSHKKLPGFKEEYFVRMEKCLIYALQQTLGDAYTDNMDRIYKQWISWTSQTMQNGFRS